MNNVTTARVRLALEGQGQVVRGLDQVNEGAARMRSAFTALAGSLSLGATVGQLVRVQREMDVLNASMVTMTGSSAAASREMEWIKRFASQTPFQLNEVTGAFVKMKSLGLDASEKALRSYGNTASAMGKDLNQLIEAVADAATGEFERLKEFGIKAKKEGNTVAFTFQGLTTQVRNNAADITTYLQAIGNNQFAGAMERRVSTLDGAISNLSDSWDELARTVNEAGVGQLIETSVRGATSAIGGLGEIIRTYRPELAVLAGGLGGAALVAVLPKVATGLGAVALGVKAIGVAMAANPLAVALLGLGAVAGGAAAYDAAFRKTSEGMRKTIDQLEEANRMAAQNLTVRTLRPEIVRDVNAAIAERTQKINELKKALQTLDAPTGSVAGGDAALRRAEAALRVNTASSGSASSAAATSAATAAEKALTEQQRQSAEVVALRNRLVEEGFIAQQKNIEAARDAHAELVRQYASGAASAQQRLADLQHEAEAVAFAERNQISLAQAVELTTIARLKEQQVAAMGNEAIVLQLQAEIEAREKIAAILGSNAAREAGRELRQNEAAEWARTWDQVSQSFTDALMRGGKSVSEYLKDLFRTLVLRPILAPVGASMASIFTGGAQAGQGGGSPGMGSLGDLGSLLNPSSILNGYGNQLNPARIFDSFGDSLAFAADSAGQWLVNNTSGYLNSLGGNLMGNANLIGTAGSYVAGIGTGITVGRGISNGYSAIGKSGNTAVNAGTIIGAVLGGPIGAAIGGAIGGAVNRLFGRKLKDTGLEGTFSGTSGLSANTYQFYKGGTFRRNRTTRSALDEQTRSALADQYAAMTSGSAALAQALGLGTESLAGFSSSFGFSTHGLSEEKISERLTEEFQKMADAQAVLLMGTQAYVRNGESASATLQRLATSLTGVNSVLDTLGQTALAVSAASGDMASQLADLFGGLEAFGQSTAAYYQAFYTDAERTATTTRQLTTALGALGLQLPATRDAFRALVEAQDLTTEAGRNTYAALLQVAPAFAQISISSQDMAAAAAAAAQDMAEAMAQAGNTIGQEIQRLRGLTTGTGSAQTLAALQGRFAITSAQARAGSVEALNELPAISRALEEAASLQATTATELSFLRGQLAASLQATLSGLGLQVPAFAVGTNYVPRTMLAQIHEGEAIVPKAYNPAAGGSAPGSEALAAELRGLRQEVAQLRAESGAGMGAVAAHTAKTARILERAQPTGQAMLVMTQAEFDAL